MNAQDTAPAAAGTKGDSRRGRQLVVLFPTAEAADEFRALSAKSRVPMNTAAIDGGFALLRHMARRADEAEAAAIAADLSGSR